MKYCLANYILSIQPNDSALLNMFNNVSVGGEGDALSSINISIENNLWSTTGFATGAWVHDKNLSRIGSITVSISQLSDRVAKFKQLCNVYYNNDYNGLTITLSSFKRALTKLLLPTFGLPIKLKRIASSFGSVGLSLKSFVASLSSSTIPLLWVALIGNMFSKPSS